MTQAIATRTHVSTAVRNLIAGYGVSGEDALGVLRETAEQLVDELQNTPQAAYELVRLRSAGGELEILKEEGGCVSDAELAKRLHVSSRQTIHNYREKGKIFAIPVGARNFVYPAWQVYRNELLPGLEPVLSVLRSQKTSPVGIALFFLNPAEALDGDRPLDLLRRGEAEEVFLHAERHGVVGA